jgi:hypothetical protein
MTPWAAIAQLIPLSGASHNGSKLSRSGVSGKYPPRTGPPGVVSEKAVSS